MKKIHVVYIAGLSYSGSTLLNYILGAHPEIFSGGELHWLLHEDRKSFSWFVGCTHCGEECSIWSEDFISSLDKYNFYYKIAERTNSSIIVDTSKNINRLKDLVNIYEDNVTFSLIHIMKHPIRQLSSLIINDLPYKESFLDTVRFSMLGQKRRECLGRAFFPYIKIIDHSYCKIKRECPEHIAYFPVKYETIVDNPSQSLAPVMNNLGIEFLTKMLSPFDCSHHHIGGNAGTIYSATKKWPKGTNINIIKRADQEQKQEIFMDNKYKKIFSEDTISALQKKMIMKKLCRKMNYSINPALREAEIATSQ